MLMPKRTGVRSLSIRSLSIRSVSIRKISEKLRQSIRRFKTFFALVCLITIIFFFLNRSPPSTSTPSLPTTTITTTTVDLSSTDHTPTNLTHILFSIASSATSFPRREPYLRLWHKPNITRVIVFVNRLPHSTENTTTDPPLVVSENTDQFPYTYPRGFRSAIRVARMVKEVMERREKGVRWFVFGDDDTMFFPENLAAVLAGYDHESWYYIGGRSESLEQNAKMPFEMAFGGAGYAISYPLARVLARVFDSCLMRYSHLYGSDARVSACLAELGVGLTFEPGFHQVDFRGSVFGLLTAHPLSPLLSLHHLELVDPIFPQLNRTQSLKHLLKAANVDPHRILQQSVCYDRSNSLTLSISWGYAIQVYKGNHLLPDLLPLQRTFRPWRRNSANVWFQYAVNTRDFPDNPCKRPVVFFLKSVVPRMRKILTTYRQDFTYNCPIDDVIHRMEEIRVSTKKMEGYNGKVKSRRRQCCDILQLLRRSVRVQVRSCREDELITMDI